MDVTNDEYSPLSDKANDADYGVPYGKIEENKTYQMAIAMFDPKQIQSLQ